MSDKIELLKSRSRFNPFLRTVSALIIGAFLCQDMLYANPNIADTVERIAHRKLSVEIPENLGTVEEIFTGPEKVIYLIQDAHVNESAQRNIAKILDQLIQKEKIKYVFLEAGTGDDSLSDLRPLAPAKRRKDVSERFLRKGYIQGPDYLDLNSEHTFNLWGVEDKSLYLEGIELYRDIKKYRDNANAFVDKIERALRTLKPRVFNHQLLAFDKQREAYLFNDRSLSEYFKVLSDAARDKGLSLLAYPNFLMLRDVQEKEAVIDFKIANEEQRKAMATLAADDQKELNDFLSNVGKGPSRVRVENGKKLADFYALLRNKLEAGSWKLEANRFEELEKYFEYLKVLQKIRHEDLLDELKNIESQVFESLVQNDDERALLAIAEKKEILHRLVNLQAQSSDITAIQKNPEAFSAIEIGGYLNRQFMLMQDHYEDVILLDEKYDMAFEKAKAFYELTQKRDEVFVKNILDKLQAENETKAAFVAGGFHTENLKRLLREKNISFVSIIPRVLQETNIKKYERLLLDGVEEREKAGSWKLEAGSKEAVGSTIQTSLVRKMWGVRPAAEMTVLENGARLSVREMLKVDFVGAPGASHERRTNSYEGIWDQLDREIIRNAVGPVFIAVDGIRATGKSTFTGQFEKYLRNKGISAVRVETKQFYKAHNGIFSWSMLSGEIIMALLLGHFLLRFAPEVFKSFVKRTFFAEGKLNDYLSDLHKMSRQKENKTVFLLEGTGSFWLFGTLPDLKRLRMTAEYPITRDRFVKRQMARKLERDEPIQTGYRRKYELIAWANANSYVNGLISSLSGEADYILDQTDPSQPLLTPTRHGARLADQSLMSRTSVGSSSTSFPVRRDIGLIRLNYATSWPDFLRKWAISMWRFSSTSIRSLGTLSGNGYNFFVFDARDRVMQGGLYRFFVERGIAPQYFFGGHTRFEKSKDDGNRDPSAAETGFPMADIRVDGNQRAQLISFYNPSITWDLRQGQTPTGSDYPLSAKRDALETSARLAGSDRRETEDRRRKQYDIRSTNVENNVGIVSRVSSFVSRPSYLVSHSSSLANPGARLSAGQTQFPFGNNNVWKDVAIVAHGSFGGSIYQGRATSRPLIIQFTEKFPKFMGLFGITSHGTVLTWPDVDELNGIIRHKLKLPRSWEFVTVQDRISPREYVFYLSQRKFPIGDMHDLDTHLAGILIFAFFPQIIDVIQSQASAVLAMDEVSKKYWGHGELLSEVGSVRTFGAHFDPANTDIPSYLLGRTIVASGGLDIFVLPVSAAGESPGDLRRDVRIWMSDQIRRFDAYVKKNTFKTFYGWKRLLGLPFLTSYQNDLEKMLNNTPDLRISKDEVDRIAEQMLNLVKAAQAPEQPVAATEAEGARLAELNEVRRTKYERRDSSITHRQSPIVPRTSYRVPRLSSSGSPGARLAGKGRSWIEDGGWWKRNKSKTIHDPLSTNHHPPPGARLAELNAVRRTKYERRDSSITHRQSPIVPRTSYRVPRLLSFGTPGARLAKKNTDVQEVAFQAGVEYTIPLERIRAVKARIKSLPFISWIKGQGLEVMTQKPLPTDPKWQDHALVTWRNPIYLSKEHWFWISQEQWSGLIELQKIIVPVNGARLSKKDEPAGRSMGPLAVKSGGTISRRTVLAALVAGMIALFTKKLSSQDWPYDGVKGVLPAEVLDLTAWQRSAQKWTELSEITDPLLKRQYRMEAARSQLNAALLQSAYRVLEFTSKPRWNGPREFYRNIFQVLEVEVMPLLRLTDTQTQPEGPEAVKALRDYQALLRTMSEEAEGQHVPNHDEITRQIVDLYTRHFKNKATLAEGMTLPSEPKEVAASPAAGARLAETSIQKIFAEYTIVFRRFWIANDPFEPKTGQLSPGAFVQKRHQDGLIENPKDKLRPRILPDPISGPAEYIDIQERYAVRRLLGQPKTIVLGSKGHDTCIYYAVKGADRDGRPWLAQGHYLQYRHFNAPASYRALASLISHVTKDWRNKQVVLGVLSRVGEVVDAEEFQRRLGASVDSVTVFSRSQTVAAFSSDDGIAMIAASHLNKDYHRDDWFQSPDAVIKHTGLFAAGWHELRSGNYVLEPGVILGARLSDEKGSARWALAGLMALAMVYVGVSWWLISPGSLVKKSRQTLEEAYVQSDLERLRLIGQMWAIKAIIEQDPDLKNYARQQSNRAYFKAFLIDLAETGLPEIEQNTKNDPAKINELVFSWLDQKGIERNAEAGGLNQVLAQMKDDIAGAIKSADPGLVFFTIKAILLGTADAVSLDENVFQPSKKPEALDPTLPQASRSLRSDTEATGARLSKEGLPIWFPGDPSDPIKLRLVLFLKDVHRKGSVEAVAVKYGVKGATIRDFVRKKSEIQAKVRSALLPKWMPGNYLFSTIEEREALLIKKIVLAGSIDAFERLHKQDHAVQEYIRKRPDLKMSLRDAIKQARERAELSRAVWFMDMGTDPDERIVALLDNIQAAGGVRPLEKKLELGQGVIQQFVEYHPLISERVKSASLPRWIPGSHELTVRERLDLLVIEAAKYRTLAEFGRVRKVKHAALRNFLVQHDLLEQVQQLRTAIPDAYRPLLQDSQMFIDRLNQLGEYLSRDPEELARINEKILDIYEHDDLSFLSDIQPKDWTDAQVLAAAETFYAFHFMFSKDLRNVLQRAWFYLLVLRSSLQFSPRTNGFDHTRNKLYFDEENTNELESEVTNWIESDHDYLKTRLHSVRSGVYSFKKILTDILADDAKALPTVWGSNDLRYYLVRLMREEGSLSFVHAGMVKFSEGARLADNRLLQIMDDIPDRTRISGSITFRYLGGIDIMPDDENRIDEQDLKRLLSDKRFKDELELLRVALNMPTDPLGAFVVRMTRDEKDMGYFTKIKNLDIVTLQFKRATGARLALLPVTSVRNVAGSQHVPYDKLSSDTTLKIFANLDDQQIEAIQTALREAIPSLINNIGHEPRSIFGGLLVQVDKNSDPLWIAPYTKYSRIDSLAVVNLFTGKVLAVDITFRASRNASISIDSSILQIHEDDIRTVSYELSNKAVSIKDPENFQSVKKPASPAFMDTFTWSPRKNENEWVGYFSPAGVNQWSFLIINKADAEKKEHSRSILMPDRVIGKSWQKYGVSSQTSAADALKAVQNIIDNHTGSFEDLLSDPRFNPSGNGAHVMHPTVLSEVNVPAVSKGARLTVEAPATKPVIPRLKSLIAAFLIGLAMVHPQKTAWAAPLDLKPETGSTTLFRAEKQGSMITVSSRELGDMTFDISKRALAARRTAAAQEALRFDPAVETSYLDSVKELNRNPVVLIFDRDILGHNSIDKFVQDVMSFKAQDNPVAKRTYYVFAENDPIHTALQKSGLGKFLISDLTKIPKNAAIVNPYSTKNLPNPDHINIPVEPLGSLKDGDEYEFTELMNLWAYMGNTSPYSITMQNEWGRFSTEIPSIEAIRKMVAGQISDPDELGRFAVAVRIKRINVNQILRTVEAGARMAEQAA